MYSYINGNKVEMANTTYASITLNISQWDSHSQLWDIYNNYKDSLYVIHEVRVLILISLYAVIFLMALFGNSVFLCVLIREKKTRNNTNYFLLNLAVTDLLGE